nr:MAG TPA: hypothetical protein [Caudoviricetes sp.]
MEGIGKRLENAHGHILYVVAFISVYCCTVFPDALSKLICG